jgi:hypothetical protein
MALAKRLDAFANALQLRCLCHDRMPVAGCETLSRFANSACESSASHLSSHRVQSNVRMAQRSRQLAG